MADQLVETLRERVNRRKVHIPIRAKITAPYLLLTLILAAAGAFFITQIVVENIEERFSKQLFEAGKMTSELIVTYEDQLLESVRLLANIEGVAENLSNHDPNALRKLAFGMVVNNQLEAVEFFDLDGNQILSLHHVPHGNVEEYTFSTGGQTALSSHELVKNVLSVKIDEQGDKFTDLIESVTGNFLYISGPVYEASGKLAGVILIGKPLSDISQEIREKTFAQITFYDFSGKVIDSTFPFPKDLSPDTALEVLSTRDNQSPTREITDKRDLESSNIPFAEILGTFEVRGSRELGILGVALSQNSLVQTSAASRWQIFLLIASANLLIVAIGYNLANHITRPLIKLMHASLKVTEGDLTVHVSPQSNDEISILTESFNNMVTNLNISQTELIKSYDDTLEGWAKALELRDKETERHSERVTDLTLRVAKALGIQGKDFFNIRRGALLHDIGKMGTPDTILNKEGPLTEKERKIIQKHPDDAYKLLDQIDFLRPALDIPYCHHEKWDGTGYPRGLKGDEIPISARIFLLVDVWDAMTNDRPYRKAFPRESVIQYLRTESGKFFDPQITEVFIRIIESGE